MQAPPLSPPPAAPLAAEGVKRATAQARPDAAGFVLRRRKFPTLAARTRAPLLQGGAAADNGAQASPGFVRAPAGGFSLRRHIFKP